MDWKNVEILHTERNHRKRSIADTIAIKKQNTNSLNKMTDLYIKSQAKHLLQHNKTRGNASNFCVNITKNDMKGCV